jgi:hypothetical protein
MNKQLIEQMVRKELTKMLKEGNAASAIAQLSGAGKKSAGKPSQEKEDSGVGAAMNLVAKYNKAPGTEELEKRIRNPKNLLTVIRELIKDMLPNVSNKSAVATGLMQTAKAVNKQK